MAFHHRTLPAEIISHDNIHAVKLDECAGCLPSMCPDHCEYPHPPPIQSKSNHFPSTILVIMSCTLGLTFLLVFAILILRRYRSSLNDSRRINRPIFDDIREDFIDEDHGPVVDHHIWFINTVGLQQSVIDSIAVFKYKKDDGLIEGTECSVCLSEFEEDESLRLLPKCSHAFHIPCIDTWLRSHKNCPLCRAPIVCDPNSAQLSAVEPRLNDSGSREEIQVENLENSDHGSGSHEVREVGTTSEVRDGAESFGALPIVEQTIPETPEKNFPYINTRNCEVRVASDLADHRLGVEEELQPVRRSVSMDSSSASMIYLAVANAHPVEQERLWDSTQLVQEKKHNSEMAAAKRKKRNPSIYRHMKSSSFGRMVVQMGHVSMKRSFSSNGNRSLPRYSRSQDSILPL